MRGTTSFVSATTAIVLAVPLAAHAESTNDILIALQIGSEAANAAAQRGGEEIARQRALLVRRERETRAALRRAGLAEREVRRLRSELTGLQGQIEDLIASLSERDQAFAAAIRSFSEGLSGLLAKGDPRITALIERYASGDDGALLELPELTRLTVKANQAAAAAFQKASAKHDADLWRDTAEVMSDGLLRGKVTTASVLSAWQEAAALDPDDFNQWLQIARLQAGLGNDAGVRTALDKAETVATTDLQRASVLLLYVRPEYGAPAGLPPGKDPIEAALDLYRKVLAQHSDNAWLQGQVLNAIDAMVGRQVIELTSGWMGGQPPSPEVLAPTRRLADEATAIAETLLKRYPENTYILGLASEHFRRVSQVALGQRRYDDAALSFERLVEISRKRTSIQGVDKSSRHDEAAALQDLATLRDLNGDIAGARTALVAAAATSEQIWKADPANVFKRHDVWSDYTGLGFFDQSQGDFANSRTDFERALQVGQARDGLAETPYMVGLTLPRLARAQAVLGDFAGAERSLHANAELRDRQTDKSDISALDSLNDQIGLANVAFQARQYLVALKRIEALRGDVDAAWAAHQLKPGDFQQYTLICFIMATDVLIETGELEAAISQYELLLASLRARANANPGDQEAAVVAAGAEAFLQDLKGSSDGWPAIASELDAVAKQGNATNVREDYVRNALAFARARAQPLAVSGDLPARRIALLKASIAAARKLDADDPGDGYFASLVSYYMMTLARLPGSGVSWADVAGHFRNMVSRHLIGSNDDRRTSMGLAFLRERQAANAHPAE